MDIKESCHLVQNIAQAFEVVQEEIEYLREDEVDFDESASEEDLEDYQAASSGEEASSSGDEGKVSDDEGGRSQAAKAKGNERHAGSKRKPGITDPIYKRMVESNALASRGCTIGQIGPLSPCQHIICENKPILVQISARPKA